MADPGASPRRIWDGKPDPEDDPAAAAAAAAGRRRADTSFRWAVVTAPHGGNVRGAAALPSGVARLAVPAGQFTLPACAIAVCKRPVVSPRTAPLSAAGPEQQRSAAALCLTSSRLPWAARCASRDGPNGKPPSPSMPRPPSASRPSGGSGRAGNSGDPAAPAQSTQSGEGAEERGHAGASVAPPWAQPQLRSVCADLSPRLCMKRQGRRHACFPARSLIEPTSVASNPGAGESGGKACALCGTTKSSSWQRDAQTQAVLCSRCWQVVRRLRSALLQDVCARVCLALCLPLLPPLPAGARACPATPWHAHVRLGISSSPCCPMLQQSGKKEGSGGHAKSS